MLFLNIMLYSQNDFSIIYNIRSRFIQQTTGLGGYVLSYDIAKTEDCSDDRSLL